MTPEPFGTAILLATFGVLLAISAIFSRASQRAAVPLALVFLGIGMLAGSEALGGSGIQLKRRVGVTLEVESGINDPVAVILTMAATHHLLAPGSSLGWRLALDVAREIAVGAAFGVGIGYGARLLLARVRLPAGGLYPALTIGTAFLAFALPTLLDGSGFLSVYVAAVLIGNARLPYRPSLLRVHDALAWLSQIAMFLVLGLLVFPSRLLTVAGIGLALA